MKRDMELVREILLVIESREGPDFNAELEIEGYTKAQVMYHVKILAEAGFISAIDVSGAGASYFIPDILWWDGCEFLDAIRNETVWNQTKEVVKENGGSVPLEIVKALAIDEAKRLVGL